jgi:Beta-lactamase
MRTKTSRILRAVLLTTLAATLAVALTAFALQKSQLAPKSGPMEIQIDPDLQAKIQGFEAQLEALRKEHQIPGLSVAIVRNQEIVYMKGLGSTSEGGSATPDTVYPVPVLNRPVGSPWTVRDLAKLDILLDRGGIVEVQPYLAWHGEDSGGTRVQTAWEHEKAGSVLCLKAREKRLAMILVANGEVEKAPFAAAFAKAFF